MASKQAVEDPAESSEEEEEDAASEEGATSIDVDAVK